MSFLESFTWLLGAVYDVVASVFLERVPAAPPGLIFLIPAYELGQRVDEERRTLEAGPTPTGLVSDVWIQERICEAQINSEPLLPFGNIQAGVWNRWAIARCPEAHVLVYGCREPQENVWRTGFPYPDEDQKELWFHGTDHVSALSIIRDGINLQRGRGHQDFSHRDGFYLSPDFQNARRWACDSRRERPAVIVFKFKLRSYQGVTLEFKRSDWEAVIKFNRSGRKLVPSAYVSRDALIELHNCDYMIGPINGGKDGPTSKDGDWENWTPSGFDRPFKQLCVRSEAMAKALGENKKIESVIFY